MFALISPSHAFNLTFTNAPKKLQFFARDSLDSASIMVSGKVSGSASVTITVKIYKDGTLFRSFSQPLLFTDDTALFSLNLKIHAGLFLYRFEVFLNDSLASVADSVVCGDAFAVDGQSNAVAVYQTNPFSSPFIRCFGTIAPDSAKCLNDTVWRIANSTWWTKESLTCPGYIGSWAMKVGQNIVENQSIPVCIINAGLGSTSISNHQRSLRLSTIYGRFYYRLDKAGIKDKIKAILWHQGEADADGQGVRYVSDFKTLYNSWMADFPSIKHVYLYQIRQGYCAYNATALMEQQRRIPADYNGKVSILSTGAITGHDGCHYALNGYLQMGDWMYRLLARDFYASTDTLRITSPAIQSAVYDSLNQRILIRFDQPVLVPADTAKLLPVKNCFYLGTDTVTANTPIDSVYSDTLSNTVILHLTSPVATKTISYTKDCPRSGNCNPVWRWLVNSRGMGILTFKQFTLTGPNGTGLQQVTNKTTPLTLEVYPTPFSASGMIKFSIPEQKSRTLVTLKIYNATGQCLSTFFKEPIKGGARILFLNSQSLPIPSSGIYLCKLQVNGMEKGVRFLVTK